MPQDDVRRQEAPGDPEPAEDDIARIEAERRDRLAGDNRPDGAEVDNTDRDFDSEAGKFTDSPGYDPGDRPYDDAAGESGAARAAHGNGAPTPGEDADTTEP